MDQSERIAHLEEEVRRRDQRIENLWSGLTLLANKTSQLSDYMQMTASSDNKADLALIKEDIDDIARKLSGGLRR